MKRSLDLAVGGTDELTYKNRQLSAALRRRTEEASAASARCDAAEAKLAAMLF